MFPLTLATLAACLLFGGGAARGLPSDHVPQLAALPLLFVALRALPAGAWLAGPAVVALAALVLVALQLAPLPPAVWAVLPGREPLGAALAAAEEAAPWLPFAMRPDEAARALLAMLPPAALALACLQLDLARRVWLVVAILAFAGLNAMVGFLQVIGLGGAFYFYAFTNPGRSVGFFANVNHTAACLYVAIPLAGAFFADSRFREPAPGWALLAGFVTFLILGLSISGSRSALVLGVLATASLAFVLRDYLAQLRMSRGAKWLTLGAGALLVAPVALGLGLSRIFTRFDAQDVLEDARWALLPTAWRTLSSAFPLGVGAGGFETLFQLHETASDLNNPVVNHAHNDWLELAIEMGAPGLALAACAVVWAVARTWRAGRAPEDAQTRFARAAGLVILLLAVHSLWDYPLRTIALASVLAICAALLTPAPSSRRPLRLNLLSGAAESGRSRGRRRRRRISRPPSTPQEEGGSDIVAPRPSVS